MVKKFKVTGEPKGKGRPRFNPYGRQARPHTPQTTLLYENLIGWEYRQQCGDALPVGVAIKMTIKAFYAIPKSTSKAKRALMISGEIRPVKKPDIDNVVKVFADALNGVAYHDDTQLVTLYCEKYYSEAPRVEVVLEELGGDNED